MKRALHKLNHWKQQTLPGLVLTILVELGLAYGFASWAIDNGSLFNYALAILFLIGAVHNFVKVIKVVVHGQPNAGKTR